jgi:cellulose synthase/poly-beta-1,6-N-acetylglucosamine synthase-like glycosyltransferase
MTVKNPNYIYEAIKAGCMPVLGVIATIHFGMLSLSVAYKNIKFKMHQFIDITFSVRV